MSDGGWGAFDHENNLQFLNNIPFADHNAMLDPSTADVTARAIECLGQMGWSATHPVVERGGRFCGTIRLRKAPGSAAGASTTFMAPAAFCARWKPWA